LSVKVFINWVKKYYLSRYCSSESIHTSSCVVGSPLQGGTAAHVVLLEHAQLYFFFNLHCVAWICLQVDLATLCRVIMYWVHLFLVVGEWLTWTVHLRFVSPDAEVGHYWDDGNDADGGNDSTNDDHGVTVALLLWDFLTIGRCVILSASKRRSGSKGVNRLVKVNLLDRLSIFRFEGTLIAEVPWPELNFIRLGSFGAWEIICICPHFEAILFALNLNWVWSKEFEIWDSNTSSLWGFIVVG